MYIANYNFKIDCKEPANLPAADCEHTPGKVQVEVLGTIIS